MWSSPSSAQRTCQLAGFGPEAHVDPELAEWDYGDYEGWTTPQIHKRERPGRFSRTAVPAAEWVADVGALARLSHWPLASHKRRYTAVLQRSLFAGFHPSPWLGLDAACGKYFFCSARPH